MAATLANRGVNPRTGERVVPEPVVRQVLSVMSTCGMYDAAGDWMTRVGIPAKSGVAGGLIGALPGQIGIATFSPRLDPHGTSVRGRRCSNGSPPTWACTSWRSRRPPEGSCGPTTSSARAGPRRACCSCREGSGSPQPREWSGRPWPPPPAEPRVALDLTMVHSIDDVARRMLLEVARRLTLDGHAVYLVDPEGMLPDPDPGDGGRVVVIDALDSLG